LDRKQKEMCWKIQKIKEITENKERVSYLNGKGRERKRRMKKLYVVT